MHGAFGDIRSALQSRPSARAWQHLCQVLERCEDNLQTHQAIMPYVHTHLKTWPDHLRICPRRWLDQEGGSHLIGLARNVVLKQSGIDDRALRRWIDHPLLSGIKIMDLRHNWIRPQGAHALSRAATLTEMTHLLLGYNQIGDEGINHLAQAVGFEALSHLDASRNDLSDVCTAAFLHASFTKQIQGLNLSHNWIGQSGAYTLSQCRWKSLRQVNLSHNQLGDDGTEYLFGAEATFYRKLHSLDLSHNNITAKGARALAWIPAPNTLDTLILADNRLGTQGLHFLAESSRLKRLRVLDVRRNQIPDDGLWAFENLQHLPALRVLILDENHLSAAGFAALQNAQNLSNLQVLSLNHNALGDEGIEALCQIPHFRHIHTLRLDDNQLSRQAMASLRDYPFEQLRHLSLRSNLIGAEDLELLSQAKWFKGVDVVYL